MKLLDIVNGQWAIEPAKLLEIQAIYAAHLHGPKIDIAGIEKQLGRPLDNKSQSYAVIDGVAVLPIEGVIAKRMNLFSQISGGTSSELVGRDLQNAMADPAVHSIVLAIDSPGGTVDGTQTLASLVSASTKPIVSLASGAIASAAYWIGSAAQAVYIVDATTVVGSIGVVATHTDISKAQEQEGVKTTEIYAGQYKRIASNYAPLSTEGRQSIQDQVDYTYSIFVADVAKQRGVSEDTVLSSMADGRIFQGQQAVDAGLVDGVSTLGALVQMLNQNRASGSVISRAGVAHKPNQIKRTETMDIKQLAAEYPDIAAALRTEGATAEGQRIKDVDAQSLPGHEALIATLKADGKTTGPEAAIAVLNAERTIRTGHAARLAADAPAALNIAALPTIQPDAAAQAAADKAKHDGLPVEERCAALWAAGPDVRAEFSTLADFTAFAKATESGKVRILADKRSKA